VPCQVGTTIEIATKAEFLHQLRRCPEQIIVRGVLQGRLGSQSLRTVLDEFAQVCVVNPATNWRVLFVRHGLNEVAVER
jgi:hypothetical protein